MVDMGQADATLYRRPLGSTPNMCWTFALQKAARQMGYSHYTEVPMRSDEALRGLAHQLRDNSGVSNAH